MTRATQRDGTLRIRARDRIIVAFGHAFVLVMLVALCTPALWGTPEVLGVHVPQPGTPGAYEAAQEAEAPSTVVAEDPSVAFTAAIDWDALQVGDTVPLSAFPPPVVEPKPPAAVQEKQVAKRTRSYVSIPALNAVVPVSVSRVVDGRMKVPKGGNVGWLNVSKRPGANRGVTVLAGHLTNGPRGADAGPLFGAEHLAKGTPIKVVWRGKTITYKITHVTKHPRNALPPQLLDPNGKNRLALTTCTGPYTLGVSGMWWLSRNAIIWGKKVSAKTHFSGRKPSPNV